MALGFKRKGGGAPIGNKNAAGPRTGGRKIIPSNVGFNAKIAVHRALGLKQFTPADAKKAVPILKKIQAGNHKLTEAEWKIMQGGISRGTKPQYRPLYPK